MVEVLGSAAPETLMAPLTLSTASPHAVTSPPPHSPVPLPSLTLHTADPSTLPSHTNL